MISLETDSKYYNISIIRDLFNDLLVVCDYGSKLTRFAHRKNIHVASMQEADNIIYKTLVTREKHGYTVVPQSL